VTASFKAEMLKRSPNWAIKPKKIIISSLERLPQIKDIDGTVTNVQSFILPQAEARTGFSALVNEKRQLL
jgi:hypothetical protein